MDKKGQVTIYVVIGVFILFSSVLLLSYRSGLFLSEWDKLKAESLLVPEKAKDVQGFVQGCVERTAREGLDILGAQGGYIALPESELPASIVNPYSNRLDVIGGLQTAYWVYQKPNKVEKRQIPSLDDMQTELSAYVADHLEDCVQDFSAFEGYSFDKSNAVVDTEIQDDKVLFTVTYPLSFSEDGFSYSFNQFYAEADVELERLHKLAQEIVDGAEKTHFLEEKTVDLLSLYEDVPFAATELECKPKIWKKSDVAEKLKGILSSNIAAIKIDGTAFDNRKDYFVWDAEVSDASGLRASLTYLPQWPLQLDAEPSEGDLLVAKPILPNAREELAFASGLFCLLDYKFVYDVQYPVLFVLSDETGYSFQFAYHVVVDNNQPRMNLLASEDVANENQKICGNAGGNYFVNALADEGGSLNPVDAQLFFRCAATECALGDSSDGKFIGKLPQCVNGKLIARKEGYQEGSVLVDSISGGTVSVAMSKIEELPLQVQFLDSGFLKEPFEDADYYLVFSDEEKGYSTVATKDDKTVKLIPGSYNVKGYALLHSDVGFTIEGKSVEQCVNVPRSDVLGYLGVKEQKCVTSTVPDTEITDVVVGGMEVGWNVDSSALASANQLDVVIPVYPVPSTMEGMSDIFGNIQTSLNAVAPRLT